LRSSKDASALTSTATTVSFHSHAIVKRIVMTVTNVFDVAVSLRAIVDGTRVARGEDWRDETVGRQSAMQRSDMPTRRHRRRE